MDQLCKVRFYTLYNVVCQCSTNFVLAQVSFDVCSPKDDYEPAQVHETLNFSKKFRRDSVILPCLAPPVLHRYDVHNCETATDLFFAKFLSQSYLDRSVPVTGGQ